MGPTQATEEYFNRGTWGHDETQWRKLALLWGYSDRWAEWLGETKSGAGAFSGLTVVVPAGYVYVARFAFVRNNTGNRGAASIAFYDATNYHYCAYDASPVAWVPLLWNGALPLKAGDRMYTGMASCLDADVIQAGVWGYKMKVT